MIWILLRLAVVTLTALCLFTAGLVVGWFGIVVWLVTGSTMVTHAGVELVRSIERLPLPTWGSGRTYVYLLQDEQAATKIGISAQPRQRIASLQTGHPEPLHLIRAIRCRTAATARAVERDLHAHFEHYRMNGEWFDLTDRQVRRAISLARRWR